MTRVGEKVDVFVPTSSHTRICQTNSVRRSVAAVVQVMAMIINFQHGFSLHAKNVLLLDLYFCC